MATRSVLFLTHGPFTWPLDQRPLTIGRLPDCDVVLVEDAVSRHHAYIVPTPDGPLLVDRSRHGTALNGEIIRGPRLLSEHDQLGIGSVLLPVARGELPAPVDAEPAEDGRRLGVRVRRWIHRYGPSEVVGTIAAVGLAGLVKGATGSTVAAAYAGSFAETLAFYGVMFLRESLREAYQAGVQGRQYRNADLLAVARSLALEFGAAEMLDTLLIRPLCMGLGIRLLGGKLGAFTGKIVSDFAFYGPVLTVYEWRLARTRIGPIEQLQRRTTANSLRPPTE